jgi:alkane 1-monooxygenase
MWIFICHHESEGRCKMTTVFASRLRFLLPLLFFLALISPICAIKWSAATANYNAGAFIFCIFMFVLLPTIDYFLGRGPAILEDGPDRHPSINMYYSCLMLLSVPAVIGLSVYGAHFLSVARELNWAGQASWIVSLGMCVATLALCPGHELLHQGTRLERFVGGFLLAFVLNGFFNTEHIRGHHVHAATPSDIATARFNQSVYRFIADALPRSFSNAWSLEKARMERRGASVWSLRNEMIGWHLLGLMFAIIYFAVFGFPGLLFYLGQGVVALTAHQIINYIQHYGLKRRKLGNGRYERFNPSHAWNCDFYFSGMLSFQLTRHADHHLNPRRRYQNLQHIPNSPQMPLGYFGMFLMALIPPLWFRVVNRRLAAYREGQGE